MMSSWMRISENFGRYSIPFHRQITTKFSKVVSGSSKVIQSKTPTIYIPDALNPELVDNTRLKGESGKIFNLRTRYIPPSTFNYALPKGNVAEFAFIGRSNVGKSSLVGTLLNNASIVRISKEPGCTRSVNYYGFERRTNSFEVFLVDLPGYGEPFPGVPTDLLSLNEYAQGLRKHQKTNKKSGEP